MYRKLKQQVMTTTPNAFFEIIDKVSMLRQFQLFSDLNEEELQDLARATEIKSVAKHKYIFKCGEDSDFLYVLINGTIKVGNTSSDGREVIKTILHPTALFGESGLSSSEVRNSFTKAIDSDVRLLQIDVDGFRALMKSNFAFNLKVVENLGNKIVKIENRLESLVFNDARTRIVDFIRDNANKFGRKVGYEMLLKHSLTQQDIANFTGTSRQTVTSVLNDLRSSNQIYFKRKSILIRDLKTLA
jgi:CRP-like cAMP-binding protein